MKNLRLAVKIGILVVVLALTSVAIAFVGVRQLGKSNEQLNTLSDASAGALATAYNARQELLRMVRFEKNTVLAVDQARAAEFAELARKHKAAAVELRARLTSMVDSSPNAPEQKALADFDSAFVEVDKIDNELLRVAVLKTAAEAKALLYKDLNRRLGDTEEFVATLSESDGKPDAPTTREVEDPRRTAKIAAGRELVARLNNLLFTLSVHLDAEDDREMTRLDGEVQRRLASLLEGVRRLSSHLSEIERSRGAALLASLETIKPQVSKIQELSHANSDNLAHELTITRSVDAMNRAAAGLDSLIKIISNRVESTRKSSVEAYTASIWVVSITCVVGILVGLIIAYIVVRSITGPVDHGVRTFEAIASGDLSRRINLNQKDEIGRFAAAADSMAATLCKVVTQIRSMATRLGGSAGELASVSHDLLSQSQQMATQAESVAAGTEQMSTNVTSMAAAAEEMSVNIGGISSASEEVSVNVASISNSADATTGNVGSVAQAVGQITTSLQEVARDARQGSEMTNKARGMAADATGTMRQLDLAASEITKVTEVIKSIALQTNLLALNATIEAASAGEAGRGFAVVAGEIKELAGQSGQSAEDIARKIESVQASTRQAVKVIEDVARFIDQINTSAGRISDAAGVQTTAADQIAADVADARKGVESIARAIAEVAKGATDVSSNTAETSKAATDVSRNAAEAARAAQVIASNIHGVSQATRQNSTSATKVNEAAARLRQIATELQNSVARFSIGDEQSGLANA